MDEPSGLKKNKQHGKEKTKFSYYARGFHPENYCMKRTIDQMSLLLEKYNITLPEGAKKKEAGDQNNHPEIGNAIMANVSKVRYILI